MCLECREVQCLQSAKCLFCRIQTEAQDKYYTRFVPYSKVLLPFIPYVNLKINW